MRKTAVWVGVFFAIFGASAVADSLWQDDTASLTGAPKRRVFNLHDLITVVVDERSLAKSSADTSTDRRTRWEMAVDQWMRFRENRDAEFPKLGLANALETTKPGVDIDTRLRRETPASTERSSQFKVEIQAQVVDILPNGNLVVEAKKHRKVNEEDETIRISGIVRGVDVSLQNTVTSDKVADLDLRYEGEGPVGQTQKRGLLSRLLDWLWPF